MGGFKISEGRQRKRKRTGLLNLLNIKFSTKVFLLFTVSFLFIIGSMTLSFILYQKAVQTEALLEKGKLLTGILADNAIIGVFSENQSLLSDPVYVIARLHGVVSVEVFNARGRCLMRKADSSRTDRTGSVELPLKIPVAAEWRDIGDTYIFRSPVILKEGFSNDDDLLFSDTTEKGKERGIGWVSILLDKTILQAQFRKLLFQGWLIGFLFWITGSTLAYFLSKNVTRPLNRLTESVKTLGANGNVGKISVLSQDEIGNLAHAFNDMSFSLQKREAALKESEARLRFLSGRLIHAQEKERKRLSIELHDELGQSLALLKHRLRSIQKRLSDNDESSNDACSETIHEIDRIIDNVRRLSRDLSPSILEDLGLSAAVRWLIDCFRAQHAVLVFLKMDAIDPLFSEERKTNFYRIVQEIFNNIGKHANASRVECSVNLAKDSVHLIVSDDGLGFDLTGLSSLHPAERGIGLAAMDERAKMFNAFFSITSTPSKGTRIEMKIPINERGGAGGKQLSNCSC